MQKIPNFNDCESELLIYENQLVPSNNFDFTKIADQVSVYEIVRLIKGVPLFWEDHWERLRVSAQALGFHTFPDETAIAEAINKLTAACGRTDINIKLVLFKNSPESMLIYISKHYYPTELDYNTGVTAAFLRGERRNPNIKTFLPLRQIAAETIQKEKLFDVILINNDNVVTEGSRTNFFVVRNNEIFTAPSDLVLKGITRKYILKACDNLGFKHVESPFDELFVKQADICFFSGTSPKILPICRIGDKHFNVQSVQIRQLMAEYDRLIFNYVHNRT